jgi:hypothetical protein
MIRNLGRDEVIVRQHVPGGRDGESRTASLQRNRLRASRRAASASSTMSSRRIVLGSMSNIDARRSCGPTPGTGSMFGGEHAFGHGESSSGGLTPCKKAKGFPKAWPAGPIALMFQS